MKTDISLAAPAILFVFISLQANAQDRQVRDVDNFTGISVGGGINLFVEQGDEFSVEVESTRGDPDDVITEVDDGNLVIREARSIFRFGIMHWFSSHSVHVTLPDLESLSVSGGSDAIVDGVFTGEELDLSTSGGSGTTINVEMDTVDIAASGGSDIDIAGKAGSVTVRASGGSDVDALRFTADEANLTASGGSDIAITVVDRITATASGGSDITYSGNPGYEDINESGGADVNKR